MKRPVAFGLNVDPNTGGLPIAARFELGLGAGAFQDGIAGLGGPRRTTGQARHALGEAIDVIRASWAGQPYTFEGEYYQVPHTEPGPRPAHDIGIWLGVTGPRAASLLGAKADGWSVSAMYVPPERARELGDIITDSAGEAGRDPERIVRLYNLMGSIAPTSQDLLNGPAGQWIDTLAMLYTDVGMNTFVFWPSGDRERQSRIFAEEIVPAAREALSP